MYINAKKWAAIVIFYNLESFISLTIILNLIGLDFLIYG